MLPRLSRLRWVRKFKCIRSIWFVPLSLVLCFFFSIKKRYCFNLLVKIFFGLELSKEVNTRLNVLLVLLPTLKRTISPVSLWYAKTTQIRLLFFNKSLQFIYFIGFRIDQKRHFNFKCNFFNSCNQSSGGNT